MKRFNKILLSTLAVVAAPTAWADAHKPGWVSLYSGNEVNFNSNDRARVLSVLEAFGITHEVAADRQILIAPGNRSAAQDLISKMIFQVRPKGTHNNSTDTEGSLR